MLLSFKRYKGLYIYLPLNTSHFHIQSVGSREKLYTSSSSEISDKKNKNKKKQCSPAVVTGRALSYVIYGDNTRRHLLEILFSFLLYVCCSSHCFHLSKILTFCFSFRKMIVSLCCIAVYLLLL